MKEQVYLPTPLLAARFNVTNRTVERWAKAGLFGAIKINGRWYFPLKKVEGVENISRRPDAVESGEDEK